MHYHRYLADTSASQHGDALSRIGLAEILSKDANKLATVASSPYFLTSTSSSGPTSGTLPVDAENAILELTASLSTLTAERKTEATRENDLIYNAIPTAPSALPPVEKLVVAAPIPIQEVYGTPDVQKVIGPDLFGRLIPLSVHKSASIYSEEKAKLIRGEVEKCEVADESLSAALSTLGLPTALQKWKEATRGYGAPNEQTGSDVIPQEVYDWGEEMMDAGGIEDIESAKSQLATLRTSVGEALDSIGRDLEGESRECEAMRVCPLLLLSRYAVCSLVLTGTPTDIIPSQVKYEHLWTQDPSASFTRAFRADLKNHLEAYNAASSSDNQLVSLWESALPEARLVLSGIDDVERLFVEQERRGGSTSSQSTLLDLGAEEANEKVLVDIRNRVKELDEKLERLNKIVRERGEVIRDLKEKVCTFLLVRLCTDCMTDWMSFGNTFPDSIR
jgi:tyrosine-protein phosphatase non-receptor type 23